MRKRVLLVDWTDVCDPIARVHHNSADEALGVECQHSLYGYVCPMELVLLKHHLVNSDSVKTDFDIFIFFGFRCVKIASFMDLRYFSTDFPKDFAIFNDTHYFFVCNQLQHTFFVA